MITKGIVEKINENHKAVVRIPLFDSIEDSREGIETKDLSEAIICVLPNSTNVVSVGDIVIVGFEENDISKPIILGHLYKETANETQINLTLNSLKVTSNVVLPNDTNIGQVKPNELAKLNGLKDNVQLRMNYLQDEIDKIKTHLGI